MYEEPPLTPQTPVEHFRWRTIILALVVVACLGGILLWTIHHSSSNGLNSKPDFFTPQAGGPIVPKYKIVLPVGYVRLPSSGGVNADSRIFQYYYDPSQIQASQVTDFITKHFDSNNFPPGVLAVTSINPQYASASVLRSKVEKLRTSPNYEVQSFEAVSGHVDMAIQKSNGQLLAYVSKNGLPTFLIVAGYQGVGSLEALKQTISNLQLQ